MVSNTMRQKTLCTGYYDSLYLDIQHVLYDYIQVHDITLEFLDDLVVNRLRLNRQNYFGATPVERFGLADFDANQCELILKECKQYIAAKKTI